MSKISIKFYKNHEVRALWDEATVKWWFSAVDVIAAINGESDHKKARNYLHSFKDRVGGFSHLGINSTQLKLAADDGKHYDTEVIDAAGISKLAHRINNDSARNFLEWFEYSDTTIDGRSRKKAYELFDSPIFHELEVGTTKGLQQIHGFIFGGLYDFAGKIRTKNIAKDNFHFAPAQFLDHTLEVIEEMPESTFEQIIDKYTEMNIAHPFMEGNGRSTRIWLDLILKKELGCCVDWSRISKKDYLDAMKASHTDNSLLRSLIRHALTDKITDREMFMKGIDYSYYYEQED